MRRQVRSEIASFESINLPSGFDKSCDSPIPPPTDDSSDSDSYIEDSHETAPEMLNASTITYGRQSTYSEKSNEVSKEMSNLLNQVRGLTTYQDNRRTQTSTFRQETEYNNARTTKKSVADIAGAWMDRNSREWRWKENKLNF